MNLFFLNKLLKTDLARKSITSKSGGSTRYNVSQKVLASVQLLMPSLTEQQKIASFLTAFDKRIQLLEKKKETLETYKKGVMQKIFLEKLGLKMKMERIIRSGKRKSWEIWLK